MPDINDPATLVADVQLLFSSKVDGVLVLDMIALDGLVWSTGRLARSCPVHDGRRRTARGRPRRDHRPVGRSLRGARDDLVDAEHWEIVFLEGPDEQLLLELPKGRWAGDA